MKEDELFKKAWLYIYTAAGSNIGFEIKPVSSENGETREVRKTAV